MEDCYPIVFEHFDLETTITSANHTIDTLIKESYGKDYVKVANYLKMYVLNQTYPTKIFIKNATLSRNGVTNMKSIGILFLKTQN